MKEYEGKVVEVLVEGESKNNPDILAGYTEKASLSISKGRRKPSAKSSA